MAKNCSYNNLLDAHAAICTLRNLTDHQETIAWPVAVVIKHGVPCGAARAVSAHEALKQAIAADPKSAFGGIIALGAACDLACVRALADGFFELVIATDFTKDALNLLQTRKNLRLLKLPELITGQLPKKNARSIMGGMLVQDFDNTNTKASSWLCVTETKPSATDSAALDFAFRMVKSIKSNAICLATAHQVLGVGAGQPNRIQSVELAIKGALEREFDLSNAALASDGFFPFPDSIELAHHHGMRLVIQPGGSVRDKDIISTADRLGMCMVFTHERHFLH